MLNGPGLLRRLFITLYSSMSFTATRGSLPFQTGIGAVAAGGSLTLAVAGATGDIYPRICGY